MAEAIDGPREKLSEYAPAIESIKIDPEKIGAVIGKGGETIRGMQEEFEAEIDIDDDGTVRDLRAESASSSRRASRGSSR